MEMLGILSVKHLKTALGVTCEVLDFYQGDFECHIEALRALKRIISVGWPRINNHRGILLKALASAWYGYYGEKKRSNNHEEKGAFVLNL